MLLLAEGPAAHFVKSEEKIKGQRQSNWYVLEASVRSPGGMFTQGTSGSCRIGVGGFVMPLGFGPGFVVSEINHAAQQTLGLKDCTTLTRSPKP